MGTALTERQLAELGGSRAALFLCFDADAAGQAATLRGMELASSQGLRREGRAARARARPGRCGGLLRRAARKGGELRLLPRSARARAYGRPPAGVRPRARGARELRGHARAPGRAAARRRPARPAGRRLQAGLAPQTRGGARHGVGEGARGGRQARARRARRLPRASRSSCRPSPSCLPESFDSRARTARCGSTSSTAARRAPELVPLLAELDALAAREAIDEATTKELLLAARGARASAASSAQLDRRSRADEGAPRCARTCPRGRR